MAEPVQPAQQGFKSQVRRTPAQILAGRTKGIRGGAAADAESILKSHTSAVEHGFSVGPIVCKDVDALKTAVMRVATNCKVGGGGWGINRCGGSDEPGNQQCAAASLLQLHL